MAKTFDEIDISEFFTPKRKAPCKVRDLGLTDEQKTKLDAALSSPTVQTQRIADVLKSWGFPVAYSMVMRHRKKDCSCG